MENKRDKIPKIQVAKKPFEFLRNNKLRYSVIYGGAGSAKSWQVAIYLITHKFLTEPGVGIMCVRKTRPSVKISCYALIKHLLDKLEIEYVENKTELIITSVQTGAWFKFSGLDDPEKIKSIEGINYIWIEEATEITKKDDMQLNLRCRAVNRYGQNRIYRTFNPIDPIGNAWLKEITDKLNGETKGLKYQLYNTEVLHVTHKDNPFLAPEEREQIENLQNEDKEYDKIYRLGQWATPTYIVYDNWDIVQKIPEDCHLTYYGVDFGYVNPSAVVKCQTNDEGKDVYLSEVIYQTKLTNTELIEKMKMSIDFNDIIVADAAEPDRIEEIRGAGFNAIPATKGKNSLTEGIDRCKRKRLHILESSANIIKELKGYKYKVDKSDNILEEPLPFRDHAMDAMRYAIKKLDTDLNISTGFTFFELENEDDEFNKINDDRMWNVL